MYLLAGIVLGILGVLPLIFRNKIKLAIPVAVVYAFIAWPILYLTTPSFIGPLLGWYGFILATEWVLSWIITAIDEKLDFEGLLNPLGYGLPLLAIVAYFVVSISGSSIFRSAEYADLMPKTTDREWTQDIQPKDPKHMRLVSKENAIQLARNSLGQLGAIGSQFVISEELSTVQIVKDGEKESLLWIIPLDFKGLGAWYETGKVPAYLTVNAEDTHADPILVKLPEKNHMKFTPGAFFGSNAERHLRSNGYFSKGLIDWSLEIDDEKQEWWVVTVYNLEISGNAKRVEGVAIVNPTTGSSTFYPVGQTPSWVDRVMPDDIVQEYLTWQGQYSLGWLNAYFLGKELTKPETPKMIYGESGEPEWVTSITSTSSEDNSLIAVVYTNSRTGQSVRYHVNGGSNDGSILSNVDNYGDIKNKYLHGTDPQIYNIYGHMTAVVPVLSAKHTFQGVAIVDVLNPQIIAFAPTQAEALRDFQSSLSESGRQTAVDNSTYTKKVTGVVDRIDRDISGGSTIYYIYIKDVNHLFTANITASAKIAVTTKGDTVVLEYIDSDADVLPLLKFDNSSLPLSRSADQQAVQNKEVEQTDAETAKRDAQSTRDQLNKMSDKELQELRKKTLEPKK